MFEEKDRTEETQRPRNIQRDRQEESTAQIFKTEQDTDQETKQELNFFKTLTPRLELKPDPTPTPTSELDLDLGGSEDSSEDSSGDLFGKEQERNIRRSIGSDLLGLESEDLTKTEATNPLSLRSIEKEDRKKTLNPF